MARGWIVAFVVLLSIEAFKAEISTAGGPYRGQQRRLLLDEGTRHRFWYHTSSRVPRGLARVIVFWTMAND